MRDANPARRLFDYYSVRPADLARLEALSGWSIDAGDPDIRGWIVVDRNEIQVGEVDDLLVDTPHGEAVFALVKHNGVHGVGPKRVLLPLDQVSLNADDEFVEYLGVADDIIGAPAYREDAPDYPPQYDYWGRSSCIEQVTVEGDATVLPVTRILVKPNQSAA